MIYQVWDLLDQGILQRQILKNLEKQPPISMVELFVSDNCPLQCKHCFHADVRSIDTPLSLQEWQDAIDQFITLGARHFHVAGREPFTERITLDLLSYLSAKKELYDLKLGAISNGLNCRRYLPQIQQSHLDYLEISVDGLADTHDNMRGNGTYRQVVRTLKELLMTLGEHRVSTATALHKANVHQIPAIIQSLAQLGVRRIFFQPVVAMGYALSMQDRLLTGDEYRQAILMVKEVLTKAAFQDLGIAVMFYIPPEMVRSLCEDDAWLEQELLHYISHGRSLTWRGNSCLQLDFNVIHVPFWRHFILTEDGYIIDECYARSVPNYIEHSAGSIRQWPLRDLISRSRERAQQHVESLVALSAYE